MGTRSQSAFLPIFISDTSFLYRDSAQARCRRIVWDKSKDTACGWKYYRCSISSRAMDQTRLNQVAMLRCQNGCHHAVCVELVTRVADVFPDGENAYEEPFSYFHGTKAKSEHAENLRFTR